MYCQCPKWRGLTVTNSPKHAAICHRIEEVGIIPSIRTRSAEGARFAAETVAEAGIPIVEITMTVPDALRVVAELRRQVPDLIVGADSAWDLESARRAVEAGAMFITSPGLDSRSILEFVIQEDIVVIPGPQRYRARRAQFVSWGGDSGSCLAIAWRSAPTGVASLGASTGLGFA